MLNENCVTEILAKYFESLEYEIITKLTTIQKGIDLIVKDKKGNVTYIEIKGATSANVTSNRYGKPFDNNQINNHIAKALLATFKTMSINRSKNNRFAVAFPNTTKHKEVLIKIKYVLDKLNITIYLVSKNHVQIL